MVKGLFIMSEESFERVYPQHIKTKIEGLADIYAPLQTEQSIKNDPSILQDADVIFSGWGGPKLDRDFLEAAPQLNAFFYAAGSLKGMITDSCWERNLSITSAYAANAIPVAEYTLSQILFSLKYGWHYALGIKKEQKYLGKASEKIPGAFGTTVGLISLGMVGRRVCELLKPFNVHVIAYDPFISKDDAASLGAELCSLEDIFQKADIVSLHAPWLEATEGMITGTHFNSMKPCATFINTARGAVVREQEMIETLKERRDLMAILDVTYPEPPRDDSPLVTLDNVVLTPHIAGSEGRECGRMGAYMLEELKRYLKGEALQWQITRDDFAILA